MKVALDAGPWLRSPTGVGRYARELARSLGVLGVEVVPFAVGLRGSHPGVRRWRVPARVVQASWRRLKRPSITRLTGAVDVVHGTNFVLPPSGPIPGVVTIHDLSWLRDDAWPGAHRLRDLVPWSATQAAAVLVPSEAVRAEVLDRLAVPAEVIHVTPEGVSPQFFGATPLGGAALAELGIRPPFVLALGTIEPRKNLSRLLEAWTAVRPRLEGWSLVLAGPSGWGPQLPPTPGVVPIGWVGEEALPGLLAAAEAFCYPSLYEGFGLPPLEAMAAGTATLVASYPAASEVVGEAALVVDPNDVDGIAGGLVAITTEGATRARLAIAGRARAARYTWERTARATLEAYRSVVG